MQTFKYFEQHGGTYQLKVQKGFFYTMAVIIFAIMIVNLLFATTKGAAVIAVFLAAIGILGILRSTAEITFDMVDRKIHHKAFFFSTPTIYSFDDFDHFLVSKLKSLFITVGVSGILVMQKNRKTKNIFLRQCFFSAKPLQKLNDELYTIMGLPD
jgi:hypothetical protein